MLPQQELGFLAHFGHAPRCQPPTLPLVIASPAHACGALEDTFSERDGEGRGQRETEGLYEGKVVLVEVRKAICVTIRTLCFVDTFIYIYSRAGGGEEQRRQGIERPEHIDVHIYTYTATVQ